MNPLQMTLLQNKLKAAKAEIGTFARQRDMIHVERCADALEEVQLEKQRDITLFKLSRDAAVYRQIAAAEARLQDGSYGECLECGEEIGSKRLNAIPWAALCIRCQERADREAVEEPGIVFADVA